MKYIRFQCKQTIIIVLFLILLETPLSSDASEKQQPFQNESERVALIIGNANYQFSLLKNSVNDAQDIAQTLRQLGFNVILKTNADQAEMEQAINRFGKKLHRGTVGLFYYSGHGVQYDGNNYLIPIGAMSSVYIAEQLKYKTVNTGYLLGVMTNAKNKLNIVILDACRDNPFKGFSRSLQRGLTRMQESGAEGTFIAYATSPGNTASDGTGRNSPYTKHLLHLISVPNVPIELLFKKVRVAVKRETHGRQTPWYEASIEGDFYFVKKGNNMSPAFEVPFSKDNLLQEGYQFLKAEQWDKAEKQFNQARHQMPHSAEPWYWQAQLALARDNKHISLNYLEKALQLDPKHIQSLALKIKVLLLLGGRNMKKAKQLANTIRHPSAALERWVSCLNENEFFSSLLVTATQLESRCQSRFPVYHWK